MVALESLLDLAVEIDNILELVEDVLVVLLEPTLTPREVAGVRVVLAVVHHVVY